MDASHRPRRRRGGRPRLPNLALIATLYLQPAAAAALAGRPPARTTLQDPAALAHLDRRLEGEHVVLADCRNGEGLSAILSSQMAYYTGAVGATPRDVAVVHTPAGQTALWVNSVTSALFTTTTTTFTATIGPRVEEGQFAGTGNNGYGNFSCYQRYFQDLYTYGNTVCSQVYVCDHSKPPSSVPTPTPTPQPSTSSMSQGTIIGIAVGVVGGVLFLIAAGLVIWYFQHTRRDPAEHAPSSSELLRSGTMSLGPASDAGELKAQTPAPIIRPVGAAYEVDGRRFRTEMANNHGRVELDPAGHGTAELASAKAEGPSYGAADMEVTETKVISPVSPTAPEFPPDGQTPQRPQSPPPEYAVTAGGNKNTHERGSEK